MALDWSKNGGVRSSSLDSACMITALSNDLAFEVVKVQGAMATTFVDGDK